MLDDSEIYVKELTRSIVNIYKLCYEEMGYDLGATYNQVEYHNYLVNEPLYIDNEYESIYVVDNDYVNIPLDFGGDTSTLTDIIIPAVVKKNQTMTKCPQSFVNDVTQASQVTGIPVGFYIAYGFLESTWRNVTGSAYCGYFGQPANQGGTGTVLKQAQGQAITSIYRQAVNDAKKYGFTSKSDILAWCYLCHNAGNAGAKTMLSELGGKLKHKDMNKYINAATVYVNKYFPSKTGDKKRAMINEKALALPKAYYVASQVFN